MVKKHGLLSMVKTTKADQPYLQNLRITLVIVAAKLLAKKIELTTEGDK